jgi:hypothetical protein
MFLRLLGLLIVFSMASRAALSLPIEVDVPEYPVWCLTDTLRPSAEDADQQGPALMKRLTNAIDDEARTKKLTSVGLPFAASIAKTQGTDHSNDVDVTVCSAVPQDAPSPGEKIVARTEPHRKGLAEVCDEDALDSCSDSLEAAMKAAPWQLDQSALHDAARREHPALTTDSSPENAVRSLLYTKDILLGGPAGSDILSALKTAKVVVAILVDINGPQGK